MTLLRRISVVTADLAAAEQFYREGFGFERSGEAARADDGLADLLGMDHVSSRSVILQLGREELELVSYDPQGRAYPPGSAASDSWFQHIAIVVADMDAAYGLLLRSGKITPISTNGPEQLPPSTGPVTVFKFRDPEGHPIELSAFPPGVGAARWHVSKRGGNCLGIDHSAISVSQVNRSLEFYCGVLGMKVTSRSVNRGVEQDRLDGLASDGVDIVVLQPADEASPHIELLGYRPAGRQCAMLSATDIAATQLALQVDDVRGLLGRIPAGLRVSRGVVTLACGKAAALVRDPDGHLVLLRE